MYTSTETLPGLDSCSRIRVYSLGCASPNEDAVCARKDPVCVYGVVFTSYDADLTVDLGDQTRLVVTKDELTEQDVCLWTNKALSDVKASGRERQASRITQDQVSRAKRSLAAEELELKSHDSFQ